MTLDLDKFLLCNKEARTIYGKSFGFVTIKCFGKKISVQRYIRPVGDRQETYYGTTREDVSFNNIYIAKKVVNASNIYEYEKYSLNTGLGKEEFLVVKTSEKYYRLYAPSLLEYVHFTNINSNELVTAVFGSSSRISTAQLKKVLEEIEWQENETEKFFEIRNIKALQPQRKVFISGRNGGEGKIVKIKQFDFLAKKAIFEVEMYDGRITDFNLIGDTEAEFTARNSKVYLIVGNTYAPKNELCILQENLHEEKLNPFVRKFEIGLNIFWQAVQEAAAYTVELYTWWDNSVADKLYLMEKISVDRNRFYATFGSLSRGKYYVRVIAEDRTGKELAFCKAIEVDL